ncbi:MAG: CDP-diacylglycerol--serine O-phosphatidyltransferase [Calditrichaeota bacterium]|nr:CDP-diacylglycerol--serine O-phosphatidyltransferase [Calditrichota bacterium]RQW02477.1 MAG: CDP-diacylglycerol--serine O-phosphatidyltransferase [Calditrichota bacterium]
MKVKKNWVPSAFTMANMLAGYFSVILCTGGKFIQAAWLIVAAAVLDALDGKIARFAKVDSRFGVEYDSLADVVSFGLAPSFLIYRTVFNSWGILGILISAGPLVFGSIRLARFNIRLKGLSKEYFEGLPIPSAAVTMATFLVFNYHFWGYMRWEKVLLFLVIAASVLMVTSIRYETMPGFSLQAAMEDRKKFLMFFGGTVLVIIFPQEAFFPLALMYTLSGPINLIWSVFKSSDQKTAENIKEANE